MWILRGASSSKAPQRAASLRHSLTEQWLPSHGIITSPERDLNTILTMITLAGIQKILTALQMSNKFGRNCGCRHIVAATLLQCAPLPCIIDDSQRNVRECRPIGSTSSTISGVDFSFLLVESQLGPCSRMRCFRNVREWRFNNMYNVWSKSYTT